MSIKRAINFFLSFVLFLLAFSGCKASEGGSINDSSIPPSSSGKEIAAIVNGTEIPYGKLAEQMAGAEAMYKSLADRLSPEELKNKLHETALTALDNLITTEILLQKAKEYGLVLSEEDESEAEKAWEETLDSIKESVRKNYPQLKGDELEAMTKTAIEGSGMERGSVVQRTRQSILIGKLKEKVTADLPSPEKKQIEEAYAKLLKEQTEAFKDNPTAFESEAIGGSPLVYIPFKYRVLQEIYLRFDDDVIMLLNQMKEYDTEDNDSYEDMLKQEYERLRKEKLPKLRERLKNGESFSALMEENKPGSSDKYNYICEKTTRLSGEYKDAALSIRKKGECCGKEIIKPYGYAVLYLSDILEEGIRPLNKVSEAIQAVLMKKAKSKAWANCQEKWRDEAEVKIFEENIGY